MNNENKKKKKITIILNQNTLCHFDRMTDTHIPTNETLRIHIHSVRETFIYKSDLLNQGITL